MSERYSWLDAFLLGCTGAEKDYKPEWGWLRYLVGGKMFAAICSPDERHGEYGGHTLLNLKCDPLMAEQLRQQYDAIRPGFYMDKHNWIAVFLDGDVPDDLLRLLCAESHRLVFEKLTKKLQRALTEAAAET